MGQKYDHKKVDIGVEFEDEDGRVAVVEAVPFVPGLGRCVEATVYRGQSAVGGYSGRVGDFLKKWTTHPGFNREGS